MPDFNTIQTDRLENLVRRSLAVRNGGIMPTVAPELGISFDVPQLADSLALAGYWRFAWTQNQPAVVAENSYAGILNATAAQLVGVRLTVSSLAISAVQIVINEGPAVFDTLLPPTAINWLDTRRLHASVPLGATALSVGSGSNVGIPGPAPATVFSTYLLANVPFTFPEVVLAPGHQLIAYQVNVNVDLRVAGEAWLRDCLPDELEAS